MSHPLRVRRRNMRAPLNGAVLVAAPSRWRNPYRFVLRAAGPARVVAAYERWLLTRPELLVQLPSLRGKQLACYCPLEHPCHADVLARLANEEADGVREVLDRLGGGSDRQANEQ